MADVHLPAGLHCMDFVNEKGEEPESSVYTLRAAALAGDDTKCPHLTPACRPYMFPFFYGLIQCRWLHSCCTQMNSWRDLWLS